MTIATDATARTKKIPSTSLSFSPHTFIHTVMTSFIKFTALSGALNDDPLCYLLEIDQTRVLLDCGSDEAFSNVEALYGKIKRYVSLPLVESVDGETRFAYLSVRGCSLVSAKFSRPYQFFGASTSKSPLSSLSVC